MASKENTKNTPIQEHKANVARLCARYAMHNQGEKSTMDINTPVQHIHTRSCAMDMYMM